MKERHAAFADWVKEYGNVFQVSIHVIQPLRHLTPTLPSWAPFFLASPMCQFDICRVFQVSMGAKAAVVVADAELARYVRGLGISCICL